MPFEPRPVNAKAWKALDRVMAANAAMREAEAKRARQARKRAKAIEEARATDCRWTPSPSDWASAGRGSVRWRPGR